MKKFTKLLGIVLIIALVMSMGTSAFAQTVGTASGTTGTVTISNATIGEKYQGYKIFKATVARDDNNTTTNFTDDTSTSIAYQWAGTGSMPTNDYFKADATTGYITYKDESTTDLPAEAIALLKSWVGADNSTYSFPKTAETTATDTTLVFAGLEYGYWYFTSSLGTVVSVNSTNPNVSVTDKNEKPTIDKYVQEDSLVTGEGASEGDGKTGYQKQNDGEIGQTVYFKTIVHAKKGNSGYVLYDKMGTGLTFDGVNSIHVYVADANGNPGTEVDSGTNTWSASAGGTYRKAGETAGTSVEAGTAAFILTFADAYTEGLTADTDLIVTYTAKINSEAQVAVGIPNDTDLKYGQSSFTVESRTLTYTWQAKVVKYTGDEPGKEGGKTTYLPNAKFVIYKLDTNNKAVYAKVANGKLTGWTDADTTAVADLPKQPVSHFTDTTTILTSDANGVINVAGLDEGTYYLLEIEAPAGYNKLDVAKTITITSTSGTAGATLDNELTSGDSGVTTINVENNSGAVLPSTGGIGTTIFYVVGSIMVVAAGVLLITKKRMGRD